MKCLAIETSTELASVALRVGRESFTELQLSAKEHAKNLLPMIDRLLNSAEINVSALDHIAFGCGPGSFTGLRVACSLAKAFAFANDLNLYPIGGLLAMAHNFLQEDLQLSANTNILTVIDARMHQLYWAVYDIKLQLLMPVSVSAASAIVVPEAGDVILIGVGFEPYFSELPDAIRQRIVHQQVVFPHASSMLDLINQIQPKSAADSLPVYIRDQVIQGLT